MAKATLSSGVYYKDPRAALVWLETAFGFETIMLIEAPDGSVVHSEMRFGESTLMIGAEWSDDHKSPASIGGKNTQTIHIQIEDSVEAHCERARAAGAVIFAEPETQFYGARTYRCRDQEGHIFSVAQDVEVVSREDAEKASGLKITGWP